MGEIAADPGGHRYAVAEKDAVAGDCRDSLTGGEDSHEIKGVGPVDCDEGATGRRAADGPELSKGFREGVLLAGEPGDEPAAAYLAPGFQPSIDTHKVSPRRRGGFALQQLVKHDAIASEEPPSGELY